jgi:hypothetical protein
MFSITSTPVLVYHDTQVIPGSSLAVMALTHVTMNQMHTFMTYVFNVDLRT